MFHLWFTILSWAYGGVVFLRNLLYKTNIKKRFYYQKPKIITVGNLALGGTGKTPLVAYLVELLAKTHIIAILSRGYKRKSKGFQIVNQQTFALAVGDEPYLLYRKFLHNPNVMVAVCENRVEGISKIMAYRPNVSIIVLDDGFQHLSLVANLNILLTTFEQPFFQDHLLPLGRLREPRKAASRADIILVTKSPVNLTEVKIGPTQRAIQAYHKKKVPIFFTHIVYHKPIAIGSTTINTLPTELLLVTAIADPLPLRRYLASQEMNITHLAFRDHHWFDYKDILKIINLFNKLNNPDKAIITTEKDYIKLRENKWIDLLKSLPIFYIPIEVGFRKNRKGDFDQRIFKMLF